MRKLVFLFFLWLFITGNSFAFTYLGSVEGVGDPVLSVDGRSLGMGNSSIASCRGVNSIFYNPANMMKNESFSMALNWGVFPVKETIESESDATWYSSASYYKLTGAAVVCPLSGRFVLGAGYRPVMDLSYRHEYKIYDAGALSKIYKHDKNGSLNKSVISFAASITPHVSIGAGYNIFGNKYEYESQIIDIGDSKVESIDKGKFSGECYEAGINCEVISDVFDVGLKWTSAFKVKNKWNVKVETSSWSGSVWSEETDSITALNGCLDYYFPMEIGIGMNYSFQEREMSVLSVDIVKIFWEDFRYKEDKDISDLNYNIRQNPDYRNTVRISLGVEHCLNFNTLLRYGFTHMPHYSRTSSDMTMFTAGAGFQLGANIIFDIAGSYGKRNFYGKNVFFDSEQMVDERIAGLIMTAEWKF